MYKIAISGRANTGKNTLARIITKQIRLANPYTSVKYMAFADPLKEMAQVMFPKLPRHFLYGSSRYRDEIIPGAYKEGTPLTVRQLLMDLGTGLGRGYDDRIWLNNFDHRFNTVRQDIIIVTDVRFRNEFDHLREKGFYQLRLYRKTGKDTINHSSETNQASIDDAEFDTVLHNDFPLIQLKKTVIKEILPHLAH